MAHAFISIFIPFDRKFIADVKSALIRMGNPASRTQSFDIRSKLRNTGVHFTSGTIIPDNDGLQYILLEISADGSADDVINTYAEKLSDELSDIFTAAGLTFRKSKLPEFLTRHRVKSGQGLFDLPGLNFTGTPEMTVERIKSERDLAREIRKYFDDHKPQISALETVKSVREHINSNSTLRHLLNPEPLPFHDTQKPFNLFGLSIKLIATLLWPLLLGSITLTCLVLYFFGKNGNISVTSTLIMSVICTFLSVIATASLLYSRLRALENNDVGDNSLPDFDVLNSVVSLENEGQQNHMTGVSVMKPGITRKIMLRLVFNVISYLAKTSFRPGYLADIGTIHFARWVMIPKTSKLIFLSNYGGSWESYLEDFITKANEGLTGVWSNTQGYPKTKNLFFEGAKDGERFKRWARRQQVPTLFWYSAYPNLRTNRIRINAVLRRGLALIENESSASQWLSIYASNSKPKTIIEKDSVQTLLLEGLGKNPFGICMAIKLSQVPHEAKSWINNISKEINFGPNQGTQVVIQLALSEKGLRKIGLKESEIQSFPHAFQLGMSHPTRSERILKDTGEDKPSDWNWGNDQNPVDAIILLYTTTRKQLDDTRKRLIANLAKFNGQEVNRIIMSKVGSETFSTEPFGFKDGISQPIIRGARPKRETDNKLHLVEAGEFILGYPDNRGKIPNAPTIQPNRDPENILPLISIFDDETRFPDFKDNIDNTQRDLGKNGSFLVVREILQRHTQFEDYIKSQASHFKDHPGLPPSLDSALKREDWIAAKLIGRWKDGTSLTRFPYHPGKEWSDGTPASDNPSEPDNDFTYGDEDPIGLGCPFGAHIRRSNPRDSLNPGSVEQIEITNRHRILRRGRTYIAGSNQEEQDRDQGLLFMCLNGDIERQFEFIQQTWNMSRQFHGLENEVDPLMGRGGTMGRLTIPTHHGPIQLKNMKDFTTIKGGGYFFLPGRLAIEYLCRLPSMS